MPFRIRNCTFLAAGVYEVEFEYDGIVLATQPVRLMEAQVP